MGKVEDLLMPHQLEVIEKLDNGKILHGSVGDGKTFAIMGYYVAKELPKWPRDIYVITTAKKRDLLDWEKAAAQFAIGTIPEETIGGVLSVDSWNNLKNYTEIQDAFFIFDEQRLIGSGEWVKAFIKIAKNNRWVMLSATPGDTWMDYVPVFVANGYYKNRTEFKRKHVIYDSYYVKYPKIKGYINEFKLELLRNEVLVEMPFIKHTIRHMNYTDVGYDKRDYNRIKLERWNIFDQLPVKDAAEKWRLMRRVVNQDPSRLAKLREIITWHPRLIVWYNFNYELNILLDLAGEIPTSQYNGHVHDPVPEGDNWVYLVQYVAGAEAWDCTATDAMVLYSLPDSYKNFSQCLGRIDRLNTPYTDLFYYLLVSDSIVDVARKASLESKKNFNEKRFIKEMEEFEASEDA